MVFKLAVWQNALFKHLLLFVFMILFLSSIHCITAERRLSSDSYRKMKSIYEHVLSGMYAIQINIRPLIISSPHSKNAKQTNVFVFVCFCLFFFQIFSPVFHRRRSK